jgi:hypothetical protein
MNTKKPQIIKKKQTYVIAKEICELLKVDSANGYNPHDIGTEIGKFLISKFENEEFNFGYDPNLASECVQIILRVALDKIEKHSPSNILPPLNPKNRKK